MVFCTYCGQSFTRDEHLERHILTRRLPSPVQCCNLTRLTADVVARYQCQAVQMLHLPHVVRETVSRLATAWESSPRMLITLTAISSNDTTLSMAKTRTKNRYQRQME